MMQHVVLVAIRYISHEEHAHGFTVMSRAEKRRILEKTPSFNSFSIGNENFKDCLFIEAIEPSLDRQHHLMRASLALGTQNHGAPAAPGS